MCRFSGLKAEDFIGITTSLTDVQSKLSEFVYEDTILIGHSLESDLKAIKVHICVITYMCNHEPVQYMYAYKYIYMYMKYRQTCPLLFYCLFISLVYSQYSS